MKKNRKFQVKNFFWPSVVLALLVIGAIWTNAGFVQNQALMAPPEGILPLAQPQPIMQNPLPAPASPQTALLVQEGISQVVARIKPAVVTIVRGTSNRGAPSTAGGLTYLDPYNANAEKTGSGIIIDPRGYVVTTFQTVGQATTVTVKLYSAAQRQYSARVIGIDPNTDLAILKIDANETFPTIIIGNSDLLETGDIVLAVGSPFGFSKTVTMGIVSSTNRRLNINGIQYPDMIQTDATINEGNDGGPLVNIKGDMIGVNIATFMPDNQFSGISFAIPVNNIMAFLNTTLG